ncbi:MAG: N-6 DNA methylase [Bacteroidaceae bacterium]|nr:N-6 DNA methylase [Bacteroidaceae bacterium]
MAEYIAKTFVGLENILAEELIALGANDVEIGRRMVKFSGDKEIMYRANFSLRTALRILKPIKTFKARTPEQVYDEIKAFDWSQLLTVKSSFAVDTVVYSEEFTHSKFVAYKVKDAIVDKFLEEEGQRPNVSISNPDLRIHLHIAGTDCTLALDSSGESLHRRGYRQEAVEAPLNEVLAAGIILQTGWKGDCNFIDPMCGSGTFLIEAALIAKNIAPGVFRQQFAFEKWNDFDEELFDAVYNDDSQEREFEHKIFGFDIDPKAIGIARANVKAAGLSSDIELAVQNFADFEKPTQRSIMVTNPPYGERISTPNLIETYKMIGDRLKHAFSGNEAWVLSYRKECFDAIGLKPSIKYPLYNGALECELRKYVLFDGKTKAFLSDGNEVKTDNERKEMAQTHRFKKSREFKERLQQMEDNEEGDILSFTFRKSKLFDMDKKREQRKPRKFEDDRGDRKFRKSDDRKGGKPRRFDDERGGKPRRFDDERGGKPRRFDDERGGRSFRKSDDRKGGKPRKFDDRRGKK